jgi:hypothetical protein
MLRIGTEMPIAVRVRSDGPSQSAVLRRFISSIAGLIAILTPTKTEGIFFIGSDDLLLLPAGGFIKPE